MKFRPFKYCVAELMNRIRLPSFLFRAYRRREVAVSLRESRRFWYDKDVCEKVRSRAPYKKGSPTRRLEKLREAFKFQWCWSRFRYDARSLVSDVGEALMLALGGVGAVFLWVFCALTGPVLYVWRYTIGLVITALNLTPRQLERLKKLNRERVKCQLNHT